jgi:F0F1-type ATP synthase assembly protein I
VTLAVAWSCGGPLVAGIIIGGVLGWLIGVYAIPPGSPPE